MAIWPACGRLLRTRSSSLDAGDNPISAPMTNRFLGLFTPAPLTESIKLYLSANAFLRAAGIGRGLLLTWWMISPAEFGVYQLGLLLVNLLLPILSFGSYEAVARFVPEHESKGQLWRYLRTALPLSLIVGVGLCGVLFVLAGPVSRVVGGAITPASAADRAALIRLTAICVVVLVLYHLVVGVLRGRRMFRALSVMELTAGLLFTGGAVVVAALGGGSGIVVLAIYTAANLMTALVFGAAALWLVWREPHEPAAPDRPGGMRDLLIFGFWAGWAAFSWQLLMSLPALYLNRVCGEEVFATYRAMTIFTQLGYIIPAAVSVAVAASVNRIWEVSGREVSVGRLQLATRAVLLATLLLCLLLASLKSVIVLAFSESYREGAQAVQLLLIFYVLAGGLSLVTIRFTLIKKTAYTFLCWAGGCAGALLIAVVGIQPESSQQALVMTAWAGVGGVCVALLMALVLSYRSRLMPDRGTLLLLAATFLLLAPTAYLVAGGLAVALFAAGTKVVFSPDERQVLLRQASQLFRFQLVDTDPPTSDNQSQS